ncbi:hypothetical protein ACFOW3_24490, partial [Acidovorax facilis]
TASTFFIMPAIFAGHVAQLKMPRLDAYALEISVVHLSMRFGDLKLAIGTGFLYERHGKLFIVTAWHNVTGRHSETLTCESSTAAVPDNILVTLRMRINHKGHDREPYPVSVRVPLVGEKNALFYIHPQGWPRVDVVAIPFDLDSVDMEFYVGDEFRKQPLRSIFPAPGNGDITFECCAFQQFAISDHELEQEWLERVEVTEELFIPGYPENIQAHLTRPVWKRATIASSVQLGLNQQPQFLIDSASHKGMSGSPVVFYSPSGSVRIGSTTYFRGRETAILVGVYVGRVGVTETVDPQIGTVWHRSVIDKIIDEQCWERLPDEIKALPRAIEAAVKSALSMCSKELVEDIKDPSSSTRYVFQRSLMMDLHGRARPSEVLQELLAIAQTYDGPYTPDEGD